MNLRLPVALELTRSSESTIHVLYDRERKQLMARGCTRMEHALKVRCSCPRWPLGPSYMVSCWI